MNGATDSGTGWSGFISGAIAAWEWVERFIAALWSGLSWPHAVLIMFFFVFFCFKSEIKGVIPRIKKFGKDGFEVDVPPTQPSIKVGEIKNPPTGQFPHTFSIIIELVSKQIEGKDSSDAVQYLLSDNTDWRVLWYFENIYSYIFGGQILLLEVLNQRGGVGVSMEEANREWQGHKERNKPHMDDWEMQPYLNFLIVKDLIVMSETDIKITLTGKEFLMWMTKYGRSSEKAW